MVRKKITILFLCTKNSCRSQMAEGWAKHLKGDSIDAYSAGVAPTDLDPFAIKAMAEAGVDISAQYSKHIMDLPKIEFDYVITVCDRANESCPFFPGKTKMVHRGFEDPPLLAKNASNEEEIMKHYRRIRDEIKHFIESLPHSIEK
ncbi:MAG: arsenate reductase ArsC [Spirochaetes bacterium]|nr:arsenate reductase ArsC [Spirochaetota bacterium]